MHAVSNWTTSPGCCGFRGVYSVGRIIHRFFFRYFLFFERTRPTASTRQPCLMYRYLLVMRPFLPLGKKASYRGAYRVPLFYYSVCVRVRVTFVVFSDCEVGFHTPGIYESGSVWTNAWDVFPCMPSRVGRGRRAAVDFVVCFGSGGVFSVFLFSIFFSSNAHGLLQV